MRISDWSSDVCSSDLRVGRLVAAVGGVDHPAPGRLLDRKQFAFHGNPLGSLLHGTRHASPVPRVEPRKRRRSEEHTSELQSLMRISYAVFCLKKKKKKKRRHTCDQQRQNYIHYSHTK